MKYGALISITLMNDLIFERMARTGPFK